MKYRLMLAGVLSLALVGWIGAQAPVGPGAPKGGPGAGERWRTGPG